MTQYCKRCKRKDAIIVLTEGTWGASMKCTACGLVGDGYKEEDLTTQGGWQCAECFGNCDIHMFDPCICSATHPPCWNCTSAGMRCEDCGAVFNSEGELEE